MGSCGVHVVYMLCTCDVHDVGRGGEERGRNWVDVIFLNLLSVPDRHTDRPYKKVGSRGAFAPKNILGEKLWFIKIINFRQF